MCPRRGKRVRGPPTKPRFTPIFRAGPSSRPNTNSHPFSKAPACPTWPRNTSHRTIMDSLAATHHVQYHLNVDQRSHAVFMKRLWHLLPSWATQTDDRHRDLLVGRTPHTGRWILEDHQYEAWSVAPSSLLWLVGSRELSHQPLEALLGRSKSG